MVFNICNLFISVYKKSFVCISCGFVIFCKHPIKDLFTAYPQTYPPPSLCCFYIIDLIWLISCERKLSVFKSFFIFS